MATTNPLTETMWAYIALVDTNVTIIEISHMYMYLKFEKHHNRHRVIEEERVEKKNQIWGYWYMCNRLNQIKRP